MPQINKKKHTQAEAFWDGVYRKASAQSGGRPGAVFACIAKGLTPGRALDLGCAKGDDAVWLAKKGWQVTAVDVSSTVIGYARDNARRAGVQRSISFERHDLSESFPAGAFDFVYASFLYSPTPLARAEIFRRAAASVASGGHLLIIDHGSRAPWSWAAENTQYPTADESLAALALSPDTWRPMKVKNVERVATGPEGQKASVVDVVVYLSRINSIWSIAKNKSSDSNFS